MTEQQPYEVERRDDGFEVRRYPEHLVAEVTIAASFEDAGNQAFRFLFGYIGGENRSRAKVAMTAPVVQTEAGGESVTIAMTAPVVQHPLDATGEYRVAFVLPSGLTLQTAPEPSDPAVRLRVVPPSRTAATRFSGRWSESSYEWHLVQLRRDIAAAGLVARGAPRFARFDPPFLPAFLRRNEVQLDLESPAAPTGADRADKADRADGSRP